LDVFRVTGVVFPGCAVRFCGAFSEAPREPPSWRSPTARAPAGRGRAKGAAPPPGGGVVEVRLYGGYVIHVPPYIVHPLSREARSSV
jgi:hypothetical protein